jgi:hypothetical protein
MATNLLLRSTRIPPFWLGLAVGFGVVAFLYVVVI